MNNMCVVIGRIKNFVNGGVVIGVADVESNENTFKIDLSENIESNMKEYCKVGDLVGVKGSLRGSENGEKIEIVAQKVTFLSSKKKDEDEI